jgi:hypothetical protein
MIRLHIFVRNLVPALLGLKKEEGIVISNRFYIINVQILSYNNMSG